MSVGRISAYLVIAVAGLCAVPPAAAAPDYEVLTKQNIFDPQRKPWPDTVVPVSAVAPFGPEDVQVQGIAIVGGVKRAVVRLGGRLRQLAPASGAGRPTALLSEGQILGGYVLESIEPQQLVFASGGNRFAIAINRTMPREPALAAAPLPPVIQGPSPISGDAPSPAPPQAPSPFAAAAAAAGRGPALPNAGGIPPPAPFAGAPGAPPPFVATPGSQPAVAPPVSTGGMTLIEAIQAAQAAQRSGQAAAPAAPPLAPSTGMSLLEAIQAAQAAQRAGQLPATPVNPFLPKPQP